MEKKIYKWSQWDELNKALGFKSKAKEHKVDEVKKKAQIEKFSKCPVCGGQMTYIKGTNSLICENVIEKEKVLTSKDKNGVVTKSKAKVKEPCGYVNLVDEAYMGYVNYLFN